MPGSSSRSGRRDAASDGVRIGLTGPIGCGKSTVARWLGSGRASSSSMPTGSRATCSAAASRRSTRSSRGSARLRGRTASSTGPRSGGIVFADPAALRDLEAIVHPAVRPRILAAIERAGAAGAAAVVIEAIKLVEGGLAELCDEVWLVTCDPTSSGSGSSSAAPTAATPTRGSRPRATSSRAPAAGRRRGSIDTSRSQPTTTRRDRRSRPGRPRRRRRQTRAEPEHLFCSCVKVVD